MKKYIVNLKEVNYGRVEVEANDEQEAGDNAAIAYENGNVFWNKTDCEIGDINEEK